ncbi:hypothetical protein BDZ45DRAFT_738376 [Acephala macrosclerotiorum]|nr:hypothetical protein BDZ45DRAFT_738376 [Acephala macrosclerotiorum]
MQFTRRLPVIAVHCAEYFDDSKHLRCIVRIKYPHDSPITLPFLGHISVTSCRIGVLFDLQLQLSHPLAPCRGIYQRLQAIASVEGLRGPRTLHQTSCIKPYVSATIASGRLVAIEASHHSSSRNAANYIHITVSATPVCVQDGVELSSSTIY